MLKDRFAAWQGGLWPLRPPAFGEGAVFQVTLDRPVPGTKRRLHEMVAHTAIPARCSAVRVGSSSDGPLGCGAQRRTCGYVPFRAKT